MIKKIKLLIPTAILIFLLILSTTAPPIGNYTTQQKQEDFLFVYDLLAKEYPFFGVLERKYNIKWLAKKNTYLERIKATKNDTQFYNELKKIIGELYDGHTHIVSPSFYYRIKYLIEDFKLYSDIYHNEFFVKTINSSQKNYRYWCELFGYSLKPNKVDNDTNLSQGSKISLNHYHNEDTIYLKIKSFTMSDDECQQVSSYIASNKDCSNIIIDIRDNYGGNDLQWVNSIVKPLLKEPKKYSNYEAIRGGVVGDKYYKIITSNYKRRILQQRPNLPNYPPELIDFNYLLEKEVQIKPKDPVDFNGQIYLLINNKVFSAAESFTIFCKSTGFATLVGEQTKGDGGGITPVLVRLPNSGLLLRMSHYMTLNPDGSANAEVGTSPDIPVRARNALTEVLKVIEGRTE